MWFVHVWATLAPTRLYNNQVIDTVDTGAAEVTRIAAFALRDGAKSERLVDGCRTLQDLVSASNNAAKMSPDELAASISATDVYIPLLTFESVAASRTVVDDERRATVTTTLAADSGAVTDVVWKLSRTSKDWLIDAITVMPTEEPTDTTVSSPRWVVSRVLNALRHVDDPITNAGCDVALSFVSSDNPSSSVTRDIFRSYLDDDSYPYGVLTRWTDIQHDTDVQFDDPDQPSTATVDVTLLDDEAHDFLPWTVTIDMSKDRSRGWLIDKVWCTQY